MRRAAAITLIFLAGCASVAKTNHAPDTAAIDQTGNVNTAAVGNKGVEWNSALSGTAVILTGWVIWLSHRREMARLRKQLEPNGPG